MQMIGGEINTMHFASQAWNFDVSVLDLTSKAVQRISACNGECILSFLTRGSHFAL